MTTPSPAGPPALPQFYEFDAPRSWRAIDLVSDLHLEASRPRTLDAFAAHLRTTPADAVFILGDLFEAWIGDDARFEGFEQQVLQLLQEASARLSLAFMAGNRDFLVGTAMLRDAGIAALPDPTVLRAFGERVLLTHGDALCLSDVAYQRFRAMVRSPAWCAEALARPLAERRAYAQQMRSASAETQRLQRPEQWADVDASAAVRWMHEAAAPVLVHGHTHRPGGQDLAPGYRREVLSDWELDVADAAPRAEVIRLSLRGLERLAPSGLAAAP
ncbi:MAG TPA: UDP-2,3-diacylglucosamine diphosphatase [Methylibium sp.]|uniref:UDP-2,3-diacylglucosamine diphosphatase n=1 Tax=Methylibium sp. TaxID=2067992 RepID=UPI002DB85793|nr:UDP-2,3-diacylglucosamine diphosphatase [Methylibium sp.]HEU4458911.1 UDP-2,3-diacylglucosamine diphosphatase [Methylibium sp.]